MDMTHESQSHSRQKLQMTVGDFTTQWRIEGKGVVFQSTKCKMLVNLNSLVCVLFLFVLNILKMHGLYYIISYFCSGENAADCDSVMTNTI